MAVRKQNPGVTTAETAYLFRYALLREAACELLMPADCSPAGCGGRSASRRGHRRKRPGRSKRARSLRRYSAAMASAMACCTVIGWTGNARAGAGSRTTMALRSPSIR